MLSMPGAVTAAASTTWSVMIHTDRFLDRLGVRCEAPINHHLGWVRDRQLLSLVAGHPSVGMIYTVPLLLSASELWLGLCFAWRMVDDRSEVWPVWADVER